MTFLVVIRPAFSQPFILDVDWSIKNVGAILSQKLEQQEHVITYANSPQYRMVSSYGRKCYALVWGIMHF
jgi:hypothetical protein